VGTRLVSVALRVRDFAASAWFYREAFGIVLEPAGSPEPHAEIAWRDGAELRLALFASEGAPTQNAELAFHVDDFDAVHARALAAGAAVVREPDGQSATYRDPDGNLVTLTQRPRALRVAGVDLRRGGLAVVVLQEGAVVEAFHCETFAQVLLVDAEVVAVDIPIGAAGGLRPADQAAERFVGPGHALRRETLDIDQYARDDARVVEVHAEVSFHELGRRPLLAKNRTDGIAERRALLEAAGLELPASVARLAEPSLLDATVAAWSGTRYARGEAAPLPAGHLERLGAIWR
jgi:catechol 2,3-dioxygenase-like lactoylglutathione lyase family enzyme